MLKFCATNAPDQPHWTLNSCFSVFHTIWLYLGLFRCLKKLGAKRAEMEQLIQKFMPRSRVGIFHNKRSRFTPLEPKLFVLVRFVLFGCIWDHFITARNIVQNEPNWCNYCKCLCHEGVSEFFTMNAPDPPHWTLNSCFGTCRTVWMLLGPFRCLTKLSAKRLKWCN